MLTAFAQLSRRTLQRGLHAYQLARARPLSTEDLRAPAVVIAPHPDDEVLACGGTIALKRRLGADVTLVFLTDGASSHPDLMPRHTLRAIRRREAVAAAGVLGVPEDQVYFMNLPDGSLRHASARVVPWLVQILRQNPNAQVFYPWHEDDHDDHRAASQLVSAAVTAEGSRRFMLAYSVYARTYWPWRSTGPDDPGVVSSVREARWAAKFVRTFRTVVDVTSVLRTKEAALAAHSSQMTRMIPTPAWRTLRDWGDGEFLAWALSDHELFLAA